MPQYSKKRTGAVIPKTSNQYEVRVLSPTSFFVDNIQKPTKRPLQKPTRSAALERANIDRLLATLQEQGHEDKILEWRQLIEWRENPVLHGTHRTRPLSVMKAWANFRRALLQKAKHSASAQDLLRKLLSKQPHNPFRESPEPYNSLPTQEHAWREKWQSVNGEQLTAGQKSIIERITKLRAGLQSATPNDQNFGGLAMNYDKTIRKAIRLGLQAYPDCVEWIILRQALGERAALHALHRTHPYLERGVEQPIRGKEKALLKEICRLRDKGMSLRSTHDYLKRQGKYSHSRAAFQKWCADPVRTVIIEPLTD